MHRRTDQWLYHEQATRLLHVTSAISIMLALLRDTYEWLRSEATSLRGNVLRKLSGKRLSDQRSGSAPDQVVALSDLALESVDSRARRRLSSAAVTIELGPSECLRRPLTAIRLRASHLRSMAELDLATMPIERGDVVILFERRTAASSDNAYFVVRRSVHAAICQALGAQGRANVRVVFSEDGRSYRLDPGTERVGAAPRLFMHGLAAAAILSAAALATNTYLGIAEAKEKLRQEIALHDDEVAAIKRARERIARLDQTQESLDRTILARRNPANILDALADALPDHAWLTDVRLSHGIVEIAGVSTAPMELPSRVSASGMFDKASFQGNVAKAVNEDGERFSMRMEMSR